MRVRTAIISSGWALLLIAVFTASHVYGSDEPAPPAREQRIQAVVDSLMERLSLRSPIVVSIVPANSLMMSVEAPAVEGNPFHLAVDATFLTSLTDEELEAAVAHELGHVWVFTHHPYLQTETLANEIALRVVTCDRLVRLYAKVSEHSVSAKHGEKKGDTNHENHRPVSHDFPGGERGSLRCD